MILQGSQRGGPRALAKHLLNQVQNDHVELHQIHGLASEDLTGALLEIDAGKGSSRSNKAFYHLSLNPPPEASPTIADFESAILQAKRHIGLDGQPHVVVFHEKLGRRHAHVVFSRVNEDGKMIRVSFDKRRLQEVSRNLYQQHGWHMPIGFEKGPKDDPYNFKRPTAKLTNFRHDDWMKSDRSGVSTTDHKHLIGAAYRQSDDLASFRQALEHQGYYLTVGYRGFVAVDLDGEIHSVMRAVGERKKAVQAKLGDPDNLPVDQKLATVEQIQSQIKHRRTAAIEAKATKLKSSHAAEIKPYRRELEAMRGKQRAQRKLFKGWQHQQRHHLETTHAGRYRQGVMGLWDRVTGKARRLSDQNLRESQEDATVEQAKKDAMIREQIVERRQLQAKMFRLVKQQRLELTGSRQDMAALLSFDRGERLEHAQDHSNEAEASRQTERQEQARKPREKRQSRRRHRGRGMRRSMGDDSGPDEPS